METVLDTLKAMGKTTCRDLAARMKIEPREALEMLREQEGLETVTFLNGYWSVPGDKAPAAAPKTKIHQIAEPKKPARQKVKKTAKPEQTKAETRPKAKRTESAITKEILTALDGEYRISAAALAEKLDRKPNSLNSTIGALAKEGLVVRHVDGNNITFSLPGAAAPVATSEVATEQSKSTADSDFLNSIPVMGKAAVQQVPTVGAIAKEIRRTRTKLRQLESLRTATRELSKHKNLIRGVFQ
jgi:Mn-dependent DtxR family transcriptional regulator